MANPDDPLHLHQIISRYESEEDEFLRELENMQQCANTDTSDDFQEESPVLGTLCSLVSEINELRKENRKLRRRLIVSTTPPSRPKGVVDRVGAFLDNRHTILPRFIASAGETLGVVGTKPSSPKKSNVEIRTGARERLSSPPLKDSLTQSSYSTDLSSGTFSSSNSRYRKPPPLVLPEEMSDSDNENVFAEVTLPEYERNEDDENCLSPCRPRRSMIRRSQFSSISEHTSPSSASASSSVEPNENMTASRSSFLEFIGFKRKRDKRPAQEMPPVGNIQSKVTVKKRKRKISESDSIDSAVHYSTQKIQKEKRSSLILTGVNADSLTVKIKDRPNASDTRGNPLAGQPCGSKQIGWTRSGPGPPHNRNVSKSLKNVAEDRKAKRQSHFYDESEDDYAKVEKKSRPKSVVYLDPGDITPKLKLKAKTKSAKSVSSRDTSASDRSNYAIEEDVFQCLQEENSLLRNEIQVLKTRNNRLIDQLREKSMQLSRLQGKSNEIENQLDSVRKNSQLNEALDRLCLNERLSIGSRAVMETVEERLRKFEEKLQFIKNEALKNQQHTINSSVREQNTYQACLEQVERLQRENFSLLQLNATELASQDKLIRQKLDLMPSYDALYSFTMGIVRKLGQLRNLVIEKSNQVTHSELELMLAQSSLMITHAQMERYRIQLQINKKQRERRPISYHGDDLLQNLVNPELNFYLPFQLHGSKTEQYRKSKNSNLDNLVEANEQNIETEFLRLFDYARCLSKICEDSPPNRNKPLERTDHQVIIYRNGRATVSPTNSPIMERKQHQSSNSPHFPAKNVRLTGLKERESASRRPISLVETKDRPFSGNIRRFGEHFNRPHVEDFGSVASNFNLQKFGNVSNSGQVKAIVSSLQDVSNSAMRSPTTTPILTRKVALIGSPKGITERKLIKQSSLQYHAYTPAQNQPVYDSPPRNGNTESSDYGTIGSGPYASPSQYDTPVPRKLETIENKNVSTNTNQLGLIRRASLERRFQLYQLKQQQIQRAVQQGQASRPLPTAPPGTMASVQTRLPQPASGGSERNGSGSGASLRRTGAILRRHSPAGFYSSNINPNTENVLSTRSIGISSNPNQLHQAQVRNYTHTQSNLRFPMKSMPESPSLAAARAHRQIQSQHTHYALGHNLPSPYHQTHPHQVTIKEEEDIESSSISEVSATTTIDRSRATTSPLTTTSGAGSSRLPKPSLQMERAKKAGTSWLSKLRLNTKKS